jgi:hypothetical protein
MLKKGLFLILASEYLDHRQKWYVVPHEELPQWLLNPDTLGELANGMVAMKCDEGTNGSLFYRAEVKLGAQDQARLDEAKAARDTREAQRLLEVRPASEEAFLAFENSTLEH